MNLSRLATLAVFFMMVMSAFVTVPTYNVGADEHDEGDDGDHDDECPFDADNPQFRRACVQTPHDCVPPAFAQGRQAACPMLHHPSFTRSI